MASLLKQHPCSTCGECDVNYAGISLDKKLICNSDYNSCLDFIRGQNFITQTNLYELLGKTIECSQCFSLNVFRPFSNLIRKSNYDEYMPQVLYALSLSLFAVFGILRETDKRGHMPP
uniref:Uncharacterized protein n=1 Tax=Glossina austeni TaxID=7395 RepID=A0A1A9VBP0_GLOAU